MQWRTGLICPRLKDCKCTIYDKRFSPEYGDYEEVARVKIGDNLIPFICGRIEKLLKDKLLPEPIEQQCCYAHPELLERDDNA